MHYLGSARGCRGRHWHGLLLDGLAADHDAKAASRRCDCAANEDQTAVHPDRFGLASNPSTKYSSIDLRMASSRR
jgi:hypothetical protein